MKNYAGLIFKVKYSKWVVSFGLFNDILWRFNALVKHAIPKINNIWNSIYLCIFENSFFSRHTLILLRRFFFSGKMYLIFWNVWNHLMLNMAPPLINIMKSLNVTFLFFVPFWSNMHENAWYIKSINLCCILCEAFFSFYKSIFQLQLQW